MPGADRGHAQGRDEDAADILGAAREVERIVGAAATQAMALREHCERRELDAARDVVQHLLDQMDDAAGAVARVGMLISCDPGLTRPRAFRNGRSDRPRDPRSSHQCPSMWMVSWNRGMPGRRGLGGCRRGWRAARAGRRWCGRGLHRLRAEEERFGDGLVGAAFGDQGQDLLFAFGQSLERVVGASPVEDLGHHLWVDHGPPAGDPVERVDEFVDVGDPVLEQVADSSGSVAESRHATSPSPSP